MIQRIQTLFLTVAAGLLLSLFFCPIIYDASGVPVVYYSEVYQYLIFNIVTFVLSGVTIFSYKKLMFQIRICNLNSLILLGYQTLLAIRFFQNKDVAVFSITALFPIVAAVLTFIAMRYIARDYALIVSSSRLRGRRR